MTEKTTTCILGEPGGGKTRLAGTWPRPFFVDVDNGAASAIPGGEVMRERIPTDRNILKVIRGKLKELDKRDDLDTIVIDSINMVQQAVKVAILRGRTKMQLQDWDQMLNLMMPLVVDWHAVSKHVVVVAHSRRREKEGQPDLLTFAVQGSLRSQMPRWFDCILHLNVGKEGQRFVMTQPIIYRGVKYMAKDRHQVLKDVSNDSGIIKLENNDGYPSDRIARAVTGSAAEPEE